MDTKIETVAVTETGQCDSTDYSLSAKDRFDSCIKLADYFRQMWDSRRGYEWRISIGLWTLLGAGAVTLRSKGGIDGYILSIPVAVFYFCWLWPMWNRSEIEKCSGKHYRAEAEEILVHPNHVIRKFSDERRNVFSKILGFVSDWSMLFQLITTLFFAFALYHFNHMPPDALPTPASGPTNQNGVTHLP